MTRRGSPAGTSSASVLGRGGMAEVRRGVDLKLGRPVAIKQLRADLAADPGALKRFQREAHAVAILNHPNIAAVYDSGRADRPRSAASPSRTW